MPAGWLSDRLVLNYDIDPSRARTLLPRFLLQPLFENAIRYGASAQNTHCDQARIERSLQLCLYLTHNCVTVPCRCSARRGST